MIRVRLTAPYTAVAGPSFGTSETIALPDAEGAVLLASGRAVPDPFVPPAQEIKSMDSAPAHKMIEREHTKRKAVRA